MHLTNQSQRSCVYRFTIVRLQTSTLHLTSWYPNQLINWANYTTIVDCLENHCHCHNPDTHLILFCEISLSFMSSRIRLKAIIFSSGIGGNSFRSFFLELLFSNFNSSLYLKTNSVYKRRNLSNLAVIVIIYLVKDSC